MDKDNQIGFIRIVTKDNSIIYYPIGEIGGLRYPIPVSEYIHLVEESKLQIPLADKGITLEEAYSLACKYIEDLYG